MLVQAAHESVAGEASDLNVPAAHTVQVMSVVAVQEPDCTYERPSAGQDVAHGVQGPGPMVVLKEVEPHGTQEAPVIGSHSEGRFNMKRT